MLLGKKIISCALTVLLGRDAYDPAEYGNEIIVVVKTAFRGNLADVHIAVFSEKLLCLGNAQVSDVFCESYAVALLGYLIKKGFAYFKLRADRAGINIFCKMFRNIVVNAYRKLFVL